MNTIRDKRYNPQFGLKIEPKTISRILEKTDNLIGEYPRPVLVIGASRIPERQAVYAKSPLEHINILQADTSTDKFILSLEERETGDLNFVLKYAETGDNPEMQNAGSIMKLYNSFSNVREAIKKLSPDLLSSMKHSLNYDFKQRVNMSKIAEYLGQNHIANRFEEGALEKLQQSGVKAETLKQIVLSYPEHVHFGVIEKPQAYKNGPMKNFFLTAVSENFPAEEPVVIARLNTGTKWK